MLYRKNARTNDNISIIGFGTSYIGQAKSDDIVKVVRYAIEHGINYIDLAAANDKIFPALKQAVTPSERKNIFIRCISVQTIPKAITAAATGWKM